MRNYNLKFVFSWSLTTNHSHCASIRQHDNAKRNMSTWNNINYSLFEKRNTDPDYYIVSMRMRHIREIYESHGYNLRAQCEYNLPHKGCNWNQYRKTEQMEFSQTKSDFTFWIVEMLDPTWFQSGETIFKNMDAEPGFYEPLPKIIVGLFYIDLQFNYIFPLYFMPLSPSLTLSFTLISTLRFYALLIAYSVCATQKRPETQLNFSPFRLILWVVSIKNKFN